MNSIVTSITLGLVFGFTHPICIEATPSPSRSKSAIAKGLHYLQQEAQSWPTENECFSCHNNGDAARVFFSYAPNFGLTISLGWEKQLKWLQHPEKWETQDSETADLNPTLALLQFGTAALAAEQTGKMPTADSGLAQVCERLIAQQEDSGFWKVEPVKHVGSPGTYGNTLATAFAIQLLESHKTPPAIAAIKRASYWIQHSEPAATIDLSAGIIALTKSSDLQSNESLTRWHSSLLHSQSTDGGWGPHRNQASEVFDTSIALIALTRTHQDQRNLEALTLGQGYLLENQETSGGWPETTRPPGGQSYAQHISTSSWALSALIEVSGILQSAH